MANHTVPARTTDARRRSAHLPSKPPSQARTSGYSAARAVGSYVPTLTRKVFEKYGFSTAALVTDWGTIVGAELAAATVPERLTWPRETGADLTIEGPAPARKTGRMPPARQEATLSLRVDPACALDIQYRSAQILERINGYFGYRAVSQLRVRQAPSTRRPAPAMPAAAGGGASQSSPDAPGDTLSGISDERLRTALSRMEQAIAAERTAA